MIILRPSYIWDARFLKVKYHDQHTNPTHVTKPTHTPAPTYTHPRIPTPTHFYKPPLIHSPIHFRIKQPLLQDTLDRNSHSTFQDHQYNVPLTLVELQSPLSLASLHFNQSHFARITTVHSISLHITALTTLHFTYLRSLLT